MRILLVYYLCFLSHGSIVLAHGLPLNINPCEFVYKRAVYQDKYPIAALQEDSNFQEHIWQLRSQGKIAEAQRLEDEVATILKTDFSNPQDIREGAVGGRYYLFDLDVVGVGKKAGRHWSSSVEAEVGAFNIDRLYDFNMTPITIGREAENGYVSMQLFYKNAKQARLSDIAALESDKKKLAIFDYLINNFDRRDTNYLINGSGRIIAIDHGVSFHNARSVPYSPAAPKLAELDLSYFDTTEGKKLFKKLRIVKDNQIYRELSGIIEDRYIKEFIDRKNALVKALKH